MAGTRSKRTNENKSIQVQPGHKPTFARGDPVGTVVLIIKKSIKRNKPTFARGDPAKLGTGNQCFDGLQLVQQDATGANRPGQTNLCPW
jgi:hypothetical protein